METWKCDVCVKSFTGLVCFKQHEASEKHKKKMQMISGWENFQKHVNSLEHAIMIQRKSGDLLDQSISNTFKLKTENNQLMESTIPSINPVITLKPYAECKPCQKQFSGPEPYQQHLASAGHFKKCGHSKIMLNDEADSKVEDAKINSNLYNDPQSSISAFARCDICQLSFTGLLPYQMHLESDSHRKKVGNQLPGSSFDENLSALKCDICSMTFSGPIPYQQHLISNGHKKKINASGLSTQLTTTGSLFPLESTAKAIEQCNINDPRWYCDVCKKQCSGPIPYNSHLISRDHSKKLRILAVEENLKKIRESSTFPHVENNKTDSDLSNEVSSTVHLNSIIKKEIQESSIEYKINDLNVNIKGKDSKILSDKFQMNVNDLLALPNLNIIPPEKIDVTVFGPEDEIVFSSPRKCKQEVYSEMDEVKNAYDTEKIFDNNYLNAEKC
ncbi:hypothetical protein HNY73_020398 [Argiope bruennichi]|uniref:C2H2-type domain-containing protein n=1 Tax=Argiope bruennichi TaxID=94029 RepID=A0A8T0E7F7_ARGBR|nr:hypothetical protein HNY73_020398 [Argiope bruennichi]